jgi:hypothetical protein
MDWTKPAFAIAATVALRCGSYALSFAGLTASHPDVLSALGTVSILLDSHVVILLLLGFGDPGK